MELPFAESWKIKMVEPIRKSTRQEREQWLKVSDCSTTSCVFDFLLRCTPL